MDKIDMKNTIVLKDLPSNIIKEAYVVLKSNKDVKQIQKKEKNNKKKSKNKQEYIVKEAELIVLDFINEFENSCEAFIIGEQLKAERLKAGMTQEQLAAKIGTKKSYISRIENGHADIQLSTLFKIFQGLGRKISFTIM
mgnify:CR=1 FL=1